MTKRTDGRLYLHHTSLTPQPQKQAMANKGLIVLMSAGKNYLSRILLILLRKIKPPQPQRQATANKGLLVRDTMHDNDSDLRLRSWVIMDDNNDDDNDDEEEDDYDDDDI